MTNKYINLFTAVIYSINKAIIHNNREFQLTTTRKLSTARLSVDDVGHGHHVKTCVTALNYCSPAVVVLVELHSASRWPLADLSSPSGCSGIHVHPVEAPFIWTFHCPQE